MRSVNFRSEKMPMATLVERLLALRDTADAPSLYAGSTPTPESVASFAAENPLPVDTGVDPDHPDHDRFPLYAEAERHKLVADLAPGDAIYMPPMWWHHVRSEGALNVLVNYWFGQRQDPFPFAALMLAMHSIRELPDVERQPSPERDRIIIDYVVGMCRSGGSG